jgi:HlyD family secretion protein
VKTGLVIIVILAAIGTGGWYSWKKWGPREKLVSYRTVKVERGDLTQVVRATGTVQPIKLVQVGTQVNGIVQKLFVDFNSRVKAGDVVAQIDPAVYKANLAQCEANVARSQASVDDARAALLKASNDLVRATGLAERSLLARSELDGAIASYASTEAQLKVAQATVQQNAAALELARANLGYTRIVTPVDGIVVSRNVDEGQTVVASMSAQTLFTVATDLRSLLISASVPEADIGSIATNQKVTFNVDAYPITFTGSVDQIRLAASTVQNVVTYPVMVLAGNPEEKLFPGMTANISCIVAERTNVLKVANAALRFKPENADKSAASNKLARTESRWNGNGGGDRPRRTEGGPKKFGKLWTRSPDGSLRDIRVRLGISDGTATEVSGEDLAEDLEVITGLQSADAAAKTVNPFMQQPMGPGARPPR